VWLTLQIFSRLFFIYFQISSPCLLLAIVKD